MNERPTNSRKCASALCDWCWVANTCTSRIKSIAAKFGCALETLLDWIEAKVKGGDWKSFSAEVAEFCPDVASHGAGTIEALETEMRETKTLYCGGIKRKQSGKIASLVLHWLMLAFTCGVNRPCFSSSV